jgi:hypothetical protein
MGRKGIDRSERHRDAAVGLVYSRECRGTSTGSGAPPRKVARGG